MATCMAASTATKRKTEASVTEVPTLPVVDTSESESVRYEVCIQNFPRLVEAVRPVVVKFAVNALSKSLISEYNKCQAENPTAQEYDRASVLMSQITPKIKDSDAHFDAFVAILQELNITRLAHELKKAVDPTNELPVTASRTREDSDETTKRKTEGSVAEVPTLPVVDTSESESVRYEVCIQKFPRLVEAVRPVVVKFAVNALSKSLISEYNKCQAENATQEVYDRASVLMSQILPKIKDSDAHFDAFVGILQELEITKLAGELKKAVDPTIKLPVTASRTREDSDSGSNSGAESVDACGFKCPCGQCSVISYFKDRSTCPGQQEGTFPHLDLDNLGKDEKEKLRQQLVYDTDNIIEEFNNFSDGIFEALERNQTPVEKIVNTIITSGQRVPRPIQDTPHGDKLETITTITGIHTFLVRHKYISFFNFRILEAIINNHCKECRDDLDRYFQCFREFCKTSIFKAPSWVINSLSTQDLVLIVVVIDEMWFGGKRGTPNCSFTTNDLTAIQNKVAKVVGLERGCCHLLDISTQPSVPVSVTMETTVLPSEFGQSNLNLRLVSMALTDLLDWHKLGLMLGLKKINLDRIRVDFDKNGSERQRDEMVYLWLHSDGGASWEKLCTALEDMDQNKIANQIRRRYSMRSK